MQLDIEVSPPANSKGSPSQDQHWWTSYHIQLYDFWSSDFLSSLNFGQVTERHTYIHTYYTESDAYKPTMHPHRWVQKRLLSLKSSKSAKLKAGKVDPAIYKTFKFKNAILEITFWAKPIFNPFRMNVQPRVCFDSLCPLWCPDRGQRLAKQIRS